MLDTDAGTLAFRARLLTLIVASTGTQSLSATAGGFARTTGSFITDGFKEGMEFLASGFATPSNNGYRVVAKGGVSALALTTTTVTTAEGAGAGRALVVGLPEGRAFSNRSYTPIAGRAYIEESFETGGHSLETFPAQGATSNEDGLYVIKWWGIENTGDASIRKPTDAIKALFSPGTIVSAAGVPLRVRAKPAPRSGQIIPQGTGWAVCEVQIPWWALSSNVVTA